MRKTLSLILVLFALFAFVACQSNQETRETPQEQVTPPQDVAAPPADDKNSFLKLVGKQTGLSWKIAYAVSSDYEGLQTTSQFTQYVKGLEKFRTDILSEGMELRTYVVNQEFISCTKYSGSWSCTKYGSPDEQEETVDAVEIRDKAEEDAYTITRDGTMEVAGVSTDCYKLVAKDGSATTRYCISSDGAPLYIKITTPEGTTEMKATSYSKSVADSDFTPPATPSEAGTSPSGGDSCAYCNYLSGEQKEQCLASC